ncbi:hypothetical protein FTX61_11265 [Nitriliruptoraceae bacterium ZYF776]|nr:hypothetical protein [Profundirhabdus halotolerans]
MADKYTSRIALVLEAPVADVAEVVRAAGASKDLDRAGPVRGSEPNEAQEVHWGGRMQKAVVRQLTEGSDPLLRTETYVGSDGFPEGMRRQAQLVQALARQLKGRVGAVRDLSAMADRDLAWVNRLAIGSVQLDDAVTVVADGEGTWWVRTHGLARFDVPDLELYGLSKGQVAGAEVALRHVADQLLRGGLRADLRLPDDTPVRLVPVLEAWTHVPLDWPGVGRAGVQRGEGLDGPRASLSIHHRPRFGRYKVDLKGVLAAL